MFLIKSISFHFLLILFISLILVVNSKPGQSKKKYILINYLLNIYICICIEDNIYAVTLTTYTLNMYKSHLNIVL